MPEIGSETSKAASVNLDPDVVKRPAKCSTALTTATTVAKVRPCPERGDALDDAVGTAQENLSLAEEMELLYARSISQ